MRAGWLMVLVMNVFCSSLFAFDGGDGSQANPYQISTAEQLVSIGSDEDLLDKHYIMVADVNMADYVFDAAVIARDKDNGYNFDGISFTGLFDGNGHLINKLTIVGSGNLGLFGYIGKNGIVSNLGLVNINILGSGDNVGGLAGQCENCIKDCYARGSVVGNNYVGGIVGDYEFPFGYILNCYSECSVTGKEYVGGLTGSVYGTIQNCHSTGHVTGNSYIGGLAGNNEGKIKSCYSTGSVNGTDSVGGLVGLNEDDISDCFSIGDIVSTGQDCGGLIGTNIVFGDILRSYSTGSVNGNGNVGGLIGYDNNTYKVVNCYSTGRVSGNQNIGGLMGYRRYTDVDNCFWDMETSGLITSAGGTGKTTVEMKNISTFSDAGWDFAGVETDGDKAHWQILPGSYPTQVWQQKISTFQFAGGDGSARNPYQISNAQELLLIGSLSILMSKHFVLTENIDLSEYEFTDPVINDQDSEFIGTFDGSGNVINNLSILPGEALDPDHYECKSLGLFGQIGDYGVIKDLGIVHSNVSGGNGFCDVGILGGINNGTVINCYASGHVTKNYNGYIVPACGGLIGKNRGRILSSYSSGDVSGGDFVGGLVGYNENSISNSYSTASVIGVSYVGGFAGINSSSFGGAYYIHYCYSTGTVNGQENTGGFVGLSGSTSVIMDCFWNTETSGQSTSAGGIGLTTAQMQTMSTFTNAGWDFDNTWWINDGRDYPKLSW